MLVLFIQSGVVAQYNLKDMLQLNTARTVAMSGNFVVLGNGDCSDGADGGSPVGAAGLVSVMTKQPDGTLALLQTIAAPKRQLGAKFGSSIAISDDFMAIGAPMETIDGVDKVGSVYIYQWNGSMWDLHTHLKGVTGAGDTMFGRSLAMDALNLVIGSNFKRYGKPNTGIAYMYTLDKGVWIRKQWLMPGDIDTHDFGYSEVDIDGGTVVFVAPDRDAHVHIFEFDGTYWNEQTSVSLPEKPMWAAIDGEYLFCTIEDIPGRTSSHTSGAVLVYKKSGDGWELHQKLTAQDRDNYGWSVTLGGYIYFGYEVSVADGVAVIGAAGDDTDAAGHGWIYNAGSAYIFKLDTDGYWRQHQKIASDNRSGQERFGTQVATSGGAIAVTHDKTGPVLPPPAVYFFDTTKYPSSPSAVTKVRIFPKIGCTTCLIGGQVQVSSVGSNGPWTTIFNVPFQTAGAWNDYTIPSSPTDYRAIRYVGAYLSHCGLAEIEFYKGGTKMAGTLFHDGGGAWEAGSWDYTKAFDGKTDTYYYGRNLSGHVGMEVTCEDVESVNPEDQVSEIVFPNPVSGNARLQIKSNRREDIEAVNIYDKNSKLRVTSEIPTDIDVSGLSPGTYFLSVI